jgi:hypothetical protein
MTATMRTWNQSSYPTDADVERDGPSLRPIDNELASAGVLRRGHRYVPPHAQLAVNSERGGAPQRPHTDDRAIGAAISTGIGTRKKRSCSRGNGR